MTQILPRFLFFPLALGLDLSTSVETLVVAIEACLRDMDIAVNDTVLTTRRRFRQRSSI